MESWKDPRLTHLKSFEDMSAVLKDKGKPFIAFKKGDTIHVWNKMSKGYSYVLDEEPGKGFAEGFKPFANPGEILALGAFGGKSWKVSARGACRRRYNNQLLQD